MTEVLELPVSCSGTTHRLEVRVDARQRIRCVLHDHDQAAEEVLEALGGQATGCSRVGAALRALRRHIPRVADRVEWVHIGVTDPRELEGWQLANVRSPRVATRWLRLLAKYEDKRAAIVNGAESNGTSFAGLGFREQNPGAAVLAWKLNGFATPTAAGPWARIGCHPNTARQWVNDGVTVAGAQAWIDHGVLTPTEAIGWRTLGAAEPKATTAWRAVGVKTGFDARFWALLGIMSPDEVERWLVAGVGSVEDLVIWKKAGLGVRPRVLHEDEPLHDAQYFREHGPDVVADWLRTGLSTFESRTWLTAGHRLPGGFTPEDVGRWKAAAVHTGTCLGQWASVGVTKPEDVADWIHAGVPDGRTAAEWSRAGVRSLVDLGRWAAAGITSSEEACTWVEPDFVTSIEEVGAWRAARCRSASWARAVTKKGDQHVPTDVGMVQVLQHEFLHGADGTSRCRWDGRPTQQVSARPGAHPAAVSTERYFYAFGHRCRPEVATDVVEQDFDADGTEVSRIRRPWFPLQRPRGVASGGGDDHG